MATLHVLRVFTTPDGKHGNGLGVFLDGESVPHAERQAIAADLGYSETVFVLKASGQPRVEIYTPGTELPFAGHPLVGTAWLLDHVGQVVSALHPPAGTVPVWMDGEGRSWIRGRAEWSPVMETRQAGSVGEVDSAQPPESGFVYLWAWEDEPAGCLRARAFASDVGIVEDEATGSAAVRMAVALGRPLVIGQGVGSRLWARPAEERGWAEVGGHVVLDSHREYAS